MNIWKIISALFIAAFLLGAVGCEDNDDIGDKIEEAAEEVEDEIDDAT